MSATLRRFPAGFRWGAGLSAHQAEGGNRANDWWRFERENGHILGGAVSGDACRHFEQFDEDFARAAADGHSMHRLSLEWSRIEPERGRIDAAAIAHYHEVFASLKRHRLTPVVTLHHFTNPLWIADAGGWENRATIDRFCDYVRLCAREFGGEVDWWCTINEPEVLAFRAYSEGAWPPAKRNDSAALLVMANLLEAHGRASAMLRAEDQVDADGDGHATRIGFAKHFVELEPARPWFPFDALRAHFENALFNRAVMQSLSGELRLSIPGARAVHRRVPELKGSSDWFGLNYYTRWLVKMFEYHPHVPHADAELTNLGWEIRPRGLGQVAARAAAFTGLPVLVTEHGFADGGDSFRPRALVESLMHLGEAIERGVPVIGYLHWSLLDNFEWADGYQGRFGLYRVDFDAPSRTRTRTRSADLYARIARANAITSDVVGEAGLAL